MRVPSVSFYIATLAMVAAVFLLFGCDQTSTRDNFNNPTTRPSPAPTETPPAQQSTPTPGTPVQPQPTPPSNTTPTPTPTNRTIESTRSVVGGATQRLYTQNYDLSIRIDFVGQGQINRSHRGSYELDGTVDFAEDTN